MKKIISFAIGIFVLLNTSTAMYANIENSASADHVPDRYHQSFNPYTYTGVNVFMRLNQFYRPDGISNSGPISSQGKNNGFQFNVQFKAEVNVDKNFDRNIIVTSELEMLSEDLTKIETIRKKKVQLNKKINTGKSEFIYEVLENMNPGQYKLTYQAKVNNNEYSSLSDIVSIYFTVTDTNVVKGWNEQVSPIAMSISQKKQENKAAQCTAGHHKIVKRIIDGMMINPTDGSNTATLTGSWDSHYRDQSVLPVKGAKVEVWYQDCLSVWNKVATTQTDAGGKFIARYGIVDGAIAWKVKVNLENNYSVVRNKDNQVYESVFLSGDDLSYGGDVGPLTIPSDSATESASWAFHDAYRMYEFMSSYVSNLKGSDFKSVISYDPVSTGVSFYKPATDVVTISGEGIKANNVTLHELGHKYMYHNYDKWFPEFDCQTGRHIYDGTTEPGCAWIEGWAHFISLVVNGDRYYQANGYGWDAEHTSDFAHQGDSVEGRVAGALWDLYDKEDDGLDERDVPFAEIYKAVFSERIHNFNEFWESWKDNGGKLGPKYSIHQNEILYDEDMILRAGDSAIVEGDFDKTFLVPGYEQLLEIVTSEYKMKSQIVVDVYQDIDKEHLLFSSSKHTDGYGKTDPYLFQIRRKYYVVVRDKDPQNIVFANVQINQVRDPFMKERDPR